MHRDGRLAGSKEWTEVWILLPDRNCNIRTVGAALKPELDVLYFPSMLSKIATLY